MSQLRQLVKDNKNADFKELVQVLISLEPEE